MENPIDSKDCHLPHDSMLKLHKLGILRLGINSSLATEISTNKYLKPTKTTASAAFLFWNWVGFAIFGYSIYLSVTNHWWNFLIGFFIWQLIWRGSKRGNSENLLDAAIVDKDFYEKILDIDGWLYATTSENIYQVMQKSNEAINLASKISNCNINDLDIKECLDLFRYSGFSVFENNGFYEIEYKDSILQYEDENELRQVAKLNLSRSILDGNVVTSGFNFIYKD